MAAMYARTVAAGPSRARAAAVWRGEGAAAIGWSGRRINVTGPGAEGALPGPTWVTAWFAAAGGALPGCGQPTTNVYPSKAAVATSVGRSATPQLRLRLLGGAGVCISSRLTA